MHKPTTFRVPSSLNDAPYSARSTGPHHHLLTQIVNGVRSSKGIVMGMVMVITTVITIVSGIWVDKEAIVMSDGSICSISKTNKKPSQEFLRSSLHDESSADGNGSSGTTGERFSSGKVRTYRGSLFQFQGVA